MGEGGHTKPTTCQALTLACSGSRKQEIKYCSLWLTSLGCCCHVKRPRENIRAGSCYGTKSPSVCYLQTWDIWCIIKSVSEGSWTFLVREQLTSVLQFKVQEPGDLVSQFQCEKWEENYPCIGFCSAGALGGSDDVSWGWIFPLIQTWVFTRHARDTGTVTHWSQEIPRIRYDMECPSV